MKQFVHFNDIWFVMLGRVACGMRLFQCTSTSDREAVTCPSCKATNEWKNRPFFAPAETAEGGK